MIFKEKIKNYEEAGRPIVYIEETGFEEDMPRLSGDALKGKRCLGTYRWHLKKRIPAIGALFKTTLINVCLFAGSINTDVFSAWVEQQLVPCLPEKAVVVMDNASFHKRTDIRQFIEKEGKSLEFLPPYSPELNPIEKKWGQVKGRRRKLQCSVEALFQEKDCNRFFMG